MKFIDHWRYMMYVLRHKYFVFVGGRRLGVPIMQLVLHDWTKFLLIEWFAYVARMKDGRNSTWERAADTPEYARAWRHHWAANPHHWVHWVINDVALPMPEKYILEMIADWFGAGMAQHKPDIAGWYATNGWRMNLHPTTRMIVESRLPLLSH